MYFSQNVFADGVHPSTTKPLLAIAVTHVRQCPYCIRGYTTAVMQQVATGEKVMEAIWVTPTFAPAPLILGDALPSSDTEA